MISAPGHPASAIPAPIRSRVPVYALSGLVLAALVVAILSISGVADTPPYQAHMVQHLSLQDANPDYYQLTAGDFDGDGLQDLAIGQQTAAVGLTLRRDSITNLFQANVPRALARTGGVPQFGAAGDVTGDGRDELFVAVAHGPDEARSEWTLLGYDAAEGGWRWTVPLPPGRDVNGDGVWSHKYWPVGCLEADDRCSRPSVLVMRTVGYDKYDRALLAIDPDSGRENWAFAMGPNPVPYCFWTGDLDGDERVEIVFVGHAPGNLTGELVNGTSDDRPWLFVLASDGELIWSRTLGGEFCAPKCAVADLDGNGDLEIVTWTFNGDPNQLSVWRAATGDLIARQSRTDSFLGAGLLPATDEAAAVIVAGSPLAGLQSYVFDGFNLERGDACLAEPAAVICTGHAVPGDGPQVLASTGSEKILLLDRRLRVLAAQPADIRPSHNPRGFIWQDDQGGGFPVYQTPTGRGAVAFLAAPSPWWTRSVVQLTALAIWLIVLLAEILWRRRSRAASVAVTSTGPDREMLVRLLRELDESSHGTISATRGLTRLSWLLSTYLRQRDADAGARQLLLVRLADFQETVRPRLHEILDLAAATGFETGTVGATRAALVAADQLLARFEAADFDADYVRVHQGRFAEKVTEVDDGFHSLRDKVQTHFTIDVERIILRLLALREDSFHRQGVEMEFEPTRDAQVPGGLIDAGDFRFVLENLLDNAERALTGVRLPRLTVAMACTGKTIVITVADNGAGIAAKDQTQVFSPGFSSRVGGGLGLARSRDLLQKWNGQISLISSETGRGCVFQMVVPVSRVASMHAVS